MLCGVHGLVVASSDLAGIATLAAVAPAAGAAGIVLEHAPATASTAGGLATAGVTHVCIQSGRLGTVADALAAEGWVPLGEETDLGGAIRYQYWRDREGLIVEAESVPDADPSGADRCWLAHVAVATPDLERLVAFYARLTGTTPRRSARLGPSAKIDRLTGFAGTEVSGAWLPAGAIDLEFWTYHSPPTTPRDDTAGAGYGAIRFAVDDLATARAALAAAGVAYSTDDTGCVSGRDPDDNRFDIVAATGRATGPFALATR